MTNLDFFLLIFDYWSQKYGFTQIIKKEDRRLGCPAMVETAECGKEKIITLYYNSKYLKRSPFYELLIIALHEVGHLVDKNQNYFTLEQKIRSEFFAENWALQKIKKYYKKIYPKLCKRGHTFLYWLLLNDNKLHSIYYQAYSKIGEYKHGR